MVKTHFPGSVERIKNSKFFVKEVNQFTKFIRILSVCHLLPLRFNRDYSRVKFSFLHYKTFVSLFISSLPFLVSCCWWWFYGDFVNDYLETALKVYGFDFYVMITLAFSIIAPFGVMDIIVWMSKIFADLPELSLDSTLVIRKHSKSILALFVVFNVGSVCMGVGSYLTLGPRMTGYTVTENILNHIVAVVLPFASNMVWNAVILSILLSLVEEMREKIEKPELGNLKNWIYDTMAVFKKFQKSFNLPILVFCATGYLC